MPESHGRKVFRIQFTLPVVILLTTLSTFSLIAAFSLGMVTEKSMQRPPEFPEVETNISEEEPLSEEDLQFFGLSERNKEQESINLEELRDLKKKTEELIKKPVKLGKTLEIIKECNRLGIYTHGNFIIGFPYETQEDIKMTADYINKSNLDFFRNWLALNTFNY